MTVEVFNYGDTPFFEWMNDNPDGFVINTESRGTSGYAFLHRSNCMHIAGLAEGHRPDAFTRYDYIKVCSNDERELLGWIFVNRPNANGFSGLCKTCVPEPVIIQYEAETPIAADIEAPQETSRVSVKTYRILRDTTLARNIKAIYRNRCQICGQTIELAGGETYSEAHHIKPLGEPHNGPDIPENILCVCPNHHVQLDYCAIKLDKNRLNIHQSHRLGDEYITYHNDRIQNQ
jgi:hypothetical protein